MVSPWRNARNDIGASAGSQQERGKPRRKLGPDVGNIAVFLLLQTLVRLWAVTISITNEKTHNDEKSIVYHGDTLHIAGTYSLRNILDDALMPLHFVKNS